MQFPRTVSGSRCSIERATGCVMLVVLVLACTGVAATDTPRRAGNHAHAPGNGTITSAVVAVPTATDVRERGSADHPTLERAYPNPTASGDRGEFVVVDVPSGTDPGNYVLSDGTWQIPLAGLPTNESVAVGNDRVVRKLTSHPVVVRDGLVLANSGERLRIEPVAGASTERPGDGGHSRQPSLQVLEYRDAPEGEVVTANGSRTSWRPLGATDRPVVATGFGDVEAFVLPDAPDRPVEFVRGAEERLLLAGYTLTSGRIETALRAARSRNVTVRVLVEGEPVGGRTRRGARTLDRLVAAGVQVRVLGGPRERYHYHHAKYAVVDDRAMVLTENWKPAGTGGNSSRGWGAITHEPAIVDGLVETFRADVRAPDAVGWRAFSVGRSFELAERASASFPSRIAPARLRVTGIDLLVTPDNAHQRLLRTIERANDSIDVVQPAVGGWDDPLMVALRRAARRGVQVRVLLSDAWYVREENRRKVERFETWADERALPLTARTADPSGRFAKIHAKGAIVDDHVVFGSLNWNEQAATGNREVLLVLHGEEAADYFGRVFEADWRGDRSGMPVGIVVALLGTAVLVGLVARRVRFEDSDGQRWNRDRLPSTGDVSLVNRLR